LDQEASDLLQEDTDPVLLPEVLDHHQVVLDLLPEVTDPDLSPLISDSDPAEDSPVMEVLVDLQDMEDLPTLANLHQNHRQKMMTDLTNYLTLHTHQCLPQDSSPEVSQLALDHSLSSSCSTLMDLSSLTMVLSLRIDAQLY